MKPYQLDVLQLLAQYNTNKDTGLSASQVDLLRARRGKNLLPEPPLQSGLTIFIRQFQSPLIYILLFAALIIFFIGPDKLDAFIISAILLFNALIGSIQEGRTSQILAKLKQFIKSDCLVIRDGVTHAIDSVDLVPGDLVLLQDGQRVPADLRLIEVHNLHIDESVLTGEYGSVAKDTQIIVQHDPDLMDRKKHGIQRDLCVNWWCSRDCGCNGS